jgi:hypothetical protein
MKTTFISVMSLGVAAAIAGPADRTAAEPMVLADAELDRVTGGERSYLQWELKNVQVTSIQTGGKVSFDFRAPPRASQNANFLGGFAFDTAQGAYLKTVPEGGFDRAAR